MKKSIKTLFICLITSTIIFSCNNPKKGQTELPDNVLENFVCDVKVINRPDGNVIKYFNPFPVIQNKKYDIGTSVYKNSTSGEYTIAVLFKDMEPIDITGDLIIQSGNDGLQLKQFMSTISEVNGETSSYSIYLLTEADFNILQNSPVNSLFVDASGTQLGGTFGSLDELYIKEIECLINE